jgi:hypothetical protein
MRYSIALSSLGLILSVAVSVGSTLRTPLKFDEFGKLSCTNERIRLDNYGRALQEQSESLAVIIVYAGSSDTRVGEVSARLFGMRDRLVTESLIAPNRIVILNCGAREKLQVQFWVVPTYGRDSASVLCDVQDAVSDVRLEFPRVEKWEYECRGTR